MKHCDGKGWKTPITLALAFLLFYGFKLNIFHEVMKAFGIDTKPTGFSAFMGYVITSFLIAGGSQGIFNIMTKLKIRNPLETKIKAEKLQAKKAEEQKAKEITAQGSQLQQGT